jgi:hypothetical protein
MDFPIKNFGESYKFLVDNAVGSDKDFKREEEISPEAVIEHTNLTRKITAIYEGAESVGVKDEAIIDEIITMTAQYPSITKEQVSEIIKRSGILSGEADPETVENLNRKVQKSGIKQKSASSTKKGDTKGYDEEDLKDLYKNAPKNYRTIKY